MYNGWVRSISPPTGEGFKALKQKELHYWVLNNQENNFWKSVLNLWRGIRNESNITTSLFFKLRTNSQIIKKKWCCNAGFVRNTPPLVKDRFPKMVFLVIKNSIIQCFLLKRFKSLPGGGGGGYRTNSTVIHFFYIWKLPLSSLYPPSLPLKS